MHPVVAATLPTASPVPERQVGNLPHRAGRHVVCRRSGGFRVASVRTWAGGRFSRQYSAQHWAWPATIDNSWSFSDQNEKSNSKIAALDEALAQYGL